MAERAHVALRTTLSPVPDHPKALSYYSVALGRGADMAAIGATQKLWNTFTRLPLGSRLFSWSLCLKVPYFGTIRPHIVDMRPGRCEVHAALKRRVHNHLGTFHAIAACNMAEVAAGMLAEASVPVSHRWIPTHMTVKYVAKAKTNLRAIASADPVPEFSDSSQDWVIPVEIVDIHDTVVVTADITVAVAPKPVRSADRTAGS